MKTVLQRLVITARTPIRCATMIASAATLLITCTGPTEIPGLVTSITILATPSLLVHQTTLLEVTGRTAGGEVSISPREVAWTSSDTSVATVSPDGIVTPFRRGSVTIAATFQRPGFRPLETAAQVTIKARVKMARVFAAGARSWVEFSLESNCKRTDGRFHSCAAAAVGDSVQFVALFADIDGFLLNDAPTQTSWSSSAPDIVSVSSSGLAVGRRHVPAPVAGGACTSCADIIVSTDDGLATTQVFVTDVIVGLPTTVRFAHTATSLGPLTFIPTQGDPVTLSFGQSVERSIKSGTFSVDVEGILGGESQADFTGVVGDREYLSLYAVASPGGTDGSLTRLWSSPSTIPADSGYVRFVAGSGGALNVYIRDRGAPADGVAELCYFDLGVGTEYYHRAAGNFDIIASPKGGADTTRITLAAPAGRKLTYVIVGDTKETTQAIAFPDP